MRASSCRKKTRPSSARSMPAARHSSSGPSESETRASSSHGSACGGTTATASSTPCASGPSRAARADGVPHCLRNLRSGSGKGFGDKERVAVRLPVQIVRVDVVRRSESRDRLGRQRLDLDSSGPAAEPELAEQAPERVPPVELIASERHHDERRQLPDTTGDNTQNVERRLVGPVGVFYHHNARRRSTTRASAPQRPMRQHTALRRPPNLAADRLPDIDKRPQGARRKQRITPAPKDTRQTPLVAEPPHERGLPTPASP